VVYSIVPDIKIMIDKRIKYSNKSDSNRVRIYAYLTRLCTGMLNLQQSMKYHKLYKMSKLKSMLALAVGELHLFTVNSLQIYVVDVIVYWCVLH
jgi:hypothetical protein